MKIIECWAVHEWDGGGGNKFSYRISRDSVTKEDILKRHENAYVVNELLVVFDSFEEVEENNVISLRRSAWEKLTHLERKAIGLKNFD